MYSREPYTLDRIFRLIITVAILAMAIWLINRLKDVLLPFCVASLIAYMFEPFVQFNRRLLHLKGRVVAIFVTLFETTFFIGLFLYFFIPMMAHEISDMGEMLQKYANSELCVPYIPEAVHRFIRHNIDFGRLSSMLANVDWASTLQEALSTVWNLVAGSISFVISAVSWCIVLLYVVFIMIDYDRLGQMMRSLVPPRHRRIVFRISSDIKSAMNHYFRGQALIAFLVGVLFSIGFLIIDMPMAVVFGMFIGLLNMVPYLQLVSLVPATLLCLVYSVGTGAAFWPFFASCIAVYCIVQCIQDLILTPKIMGRAMGLNPALILLSLSIWGSLMGLIGLIIALPLTALLLSYYNEFIIGRSEPPSDRNRERRLVNEVTKFPDAD